MAIVGSIFWKDLEYKLVWHDCDSFDVIKDKKLQQSYRVCFYKDKLVITRGSGGWNLVGGHVEKDETPEIALAREVIEESKLIDPKDYKKYFD